MIRPSLPARIVLAAVVAASSWNPSRVLAGPPSAANAESSEEASPLGEPIAILNVAGVGRVLDDIRWTFAAAAREDLNDAVSTVLSAVGDLKGLDRERPLGVMAFMAPGGNGQPLVVGYVPVTDLDQLMSSLTIGPIRPEPVPGKAGVWRIANPDGNQGAVFVGARNGYAYVVRDPAHLEIVYPNPARFAKPLTERYDVAASLNLDGIPPGLRFLAAAGLRAVANNASPKKADESDEQYALRREALDEIVTVANRFLNEGRDVTWGLDYSRDRGEVLVEVAANAKNGTRLAAELESLTGAPSRFAAARTEHAPLAMSFSFSPSDPFRLFGRRAFEQARRTAGDADDPVLDYVFDAATAMIEAESTEFGMWATGGPPHGLTVFSGLRMQNAGEVFEPFLDFLGKSIEGRDDVTLRRNAFEHRGFVFHEMTGEGADEGLRRLVGGKPFGYFGTKDDVLLYAVGGKSTPEALKKAVDAIEGGDDNSTNDETSESTSRPMFSLEARAATLMLLGEERDPEFEAIAQRAFLRGGDELKLVIGPKTDGFAARFTAAEGWVRLLGLGIAKAYDENQ